jgi:hypothetical protein
MFRKLMIVCWTLFALFTALAVICWHYFTEASQRGEIYATQSFEDGFWFGIIGASLMVVWNIIWHIGHSIRSRRNKSE